MEIYSTIKARNQSFWLHIHCSVALTTRTNLLVLESGKEGDEVRSLLLLLETGEDHLRARDVLLRVDKVLEQVLLAPHNAGSLIGLTEGESLHLAGLSADQAVQVRALLGRTTLVLGMALRALRFEQLGALGGVTGGNFNIGFSNDHLYAILTRVYQVEYEMTVNQSA